MSKDIRSFFSIVNKRTSSVPKNLLQQKRKASNLSSSDEEKELTKSYESRKKCKFFESDDIPNKTLLEKKLSPTQNKKHLNDIDLFNMFGGETIKRKKRSKIEAEPKSSSQLNILNADCSLIAEVIDINVSSEGLIKKESKLEPKSPKNVTTPQMYESTLGETMKKSNSPEKKENKTKVENMTSFEGDQVRLDRKMTAAALFHQFPKGKDCLKGTQFVVTGVLESMEREEAEILIKSHGGNVVKALSRKVTHLLVGSEPGPAKLAKAEEIGIVKITEDGLLTFINESGLSEDVSFPKKKSYEVKSDLSSKKNCAINQKTLLKKSTSLKTKPEGKLTELPVQVSVSMPMNENDFSFVDKYKPTSVNQIIGQQGPSSAAQKLLNWLTKWHTNHDGKKKTVRPNKWAKDNDGTTYKAALLSGSAGIGKTTTVHMVCKELLFDTVEFNASDTRNKRLLKEEVYSLLSNKSLAGYFPGSEVKISQKRVLIMDEVDGMAGNEDRGGVAELIVLIKNSRIPIICMCNDRNHPKIRSLANHCFDLRFSKPSVNQIRGAMMSVCFKEGIKLEVGAIDEIITGTGNDIRQTLNHLALYSASKNVKLAVSDAKKNAQMSEKDIKIGSFEAMRKVFSAEDHKKMSFQEKSDLFFHDYNMAPLFVQENYLRVKPNSEKSQLLEKVASAANSLSVGDLVERKIRSDQSWSLLPTQAIFSSVLPGEYLNGIFASPVINFPGWLGKTSRANKRKRLAQEIHDHTRTATISGSQLAVRLDYAPFLNRKIVGPLVEKGLGGISESLKVIKEYRLCKDDIESLLELTTWPKTKSLWSTVDSKVKSALTRAYNKEVQPYSYTVQTSVKKRAARYTDTQDEYFEDNQGDSSVEDIDETLESNALVKTLMKSKELELKAGMSKSCSLLKPLKRIKSKSKK